MCSEVVHCGLHLPPLHHQERSQSLGGSPVRPRFKKVDRTSSLERTTHPSADFALLRALKGLLLKLDWDHSRAAGERMSDFFLESYDDAVDLCFYHYRHRLAFLRDVKQCSDIQNESMPSSFATNGDTFLA